MVDSVASIPFQWFLGDFINDRDTEEVEWSDAGVFIRLFRIARSLRVLRLLRLMKLKRIVIKIEDYVASMTVANVLQLLRLLFIVFLLAHWSACLLFFVSSGEMVKGKLTWVGLLHTESAFEIYVTAVYFSFATLTTVGYGDVHPYTRTESIFAIIVMVVACGAFAYTVSSINSLFSKSATEENEYRLRAAALRQFMRKKDIPMPTQMRVARYFEYVWNRNQSLMLLEREVVELLSPALRLEIYSYVHGSVLTSCSAFRSFDAALVSSLSNLLESETFAPSDIVFQEGERSTRIYFVGYGTVRVYHQDSGSQYAVLQSDDYFGEIAFFLETQRCAAAACLSFADLLSLRREHLLDISDKYPGTKEIMQRFVVKCVTGDLSLLDVRCYACNSVGHIAKLCAKQTVSIQPESMSQGRSYSHSRLVSCDRYYKPNFNRLRRPRVKVAYQARNVIGLPSTIRELFGDKSPLLHLAQHFDDKDESLNSAINLQSIRLLDNDVYRREKLNLSKLLEEEDEPELVGNAVRRKTFRKSLMRQVPLGVKLETPVLSTNEKMAAGKQNPCTQGSELRGRQRKERSNPAETDEFSFRERPDRRRIPRTTPAALAE